VVLLHVHVNIISHFADRYYYYLLLFRCVRGTIRAARNAIAIYRETGRRRIGWQRQSSTIINNIRTIIVFGKRSVVVVDRLNILFVKL
jgi:hypothetical protein